MRIINLAIMSTHQDDVWRYIEISVFLCEEAGAAVPLGFYYFEKKNSDINMLNYVAAVLLLLSIGDAFQGYKIMGLYQRRSIQQLFALSEDLTDLTVTELKNKLRSAGMPLTGAKKDLIARLIPSTSSKAPTEDSATEEKTNVVKTTKRLSGLLRRKPKITSDSADVVSREVKEVDIEEVFVQVPLPQKSVKPVAVSQWGSRKELVDKTPAVEIKKTIPAVVDSVASVVRKIEPEAISTTKVTAKDVKIDSKKPTKSVKQVVAAYDIDDDDFLDSFMDSGDKPVQQQQVC